MSLLPIVLVMAEFYAASGPVSILEVGCGNGNFAKAVCTELAAKNVKFAYHAVDPFPSASGLSSSLGKTRARS
jgi:hypothetical protein